MRWRKSNHCIPSSNKQSSSYITRYNRAGYGGHSMIEVFINIKTRAYSFNASGTLEVQRDLGGEKQSLTLTENHSKRLSGKTEQYQLSKSYRWYGQCGYSIFGDRQVAPNQAARLVGIFSIFAELAPEQLPALSNLLRGRSRCPLATEPSKIYPSAHLMRHARAIAPGWFIDTNTDTTDKIAMIKNACKFLGLEFGRDVVLLS